MKKAILIAGYPGAGKTTLSAYLAKKLHYLHFEYDICLLNKNYYDGLNHDKIIIDGWFKNTHDISLTIDQYIKLGYDITIIHLNIDKEVCKENIFNRFMKTGRRTVDIEPINCVYYWDILKQNFKFKLIEINYYMNPSLILNEILNSKI